MTSESSNLFSDKYVSYLGQKRRTWSIDETESLGSLVAENPNIRTAAYLLRDATLLAKSTSSFAPIDVVLSVKPESQMSRIFHGLLTSSVIQILLRICMTGSFVLIPNGKRTVVHFRQSVL